MPVDSREQALDDLLGLRGNLPADDFVLGVMRQVNREQRRRRIILGLFGLVGAVFGLIGASLLSGPIAALFAGLPAIGVMQVVLLAVAFGAFYLWFMHEDMSLPS